MVNAPSGPSDTKGSLVFYCVHVESLSGGGGGGGQEEEVIRPFFEEIIRIGKSISS